MVNRQHPLLLQELKELVRGAVELQEPSLSLSLLLPPTCLVPALCQPHVSVPSPLETCVGLEEAGDEGERGGKGGEEE